MKNISIIWQCNISIIFIRDKNIERSILLQDAEMLIASDYTYETRPCEVTPRFGKLFTTSAPNKDFSANSVYY